MRTFTTQTWMLRINLFSVPKNTRQDQLYSLHRAPMQNENEGLLVHEFVSISRQWLQSMKPQNSSTFRALCNDTDPISDWGSLDLHSHQWVAASAASLGPRQTLLRDKLAQCHPQAGAYLLALSNFSYAFLYFFKHIKSTHYTEAACFGDLNSGFFPFSPGTSSFWSFSSK